MFLMPPPTTIANATLLDCARSEMTLDFLEVKCLAIKRTNVIPIHHDFTAPYDLEDASTGEALNRK